MTRTLHLDPRTMPEEVRKVCHAAFPSYNGRMFKVRYADGPLSVRSYWDGGSRDTYAFVRLADYATLPVPTAHPVFDREAPRDVDAVEIPSGAVCVEHTIFCGKDLGLTIHVRAEDATPLLPPPDDVPPDVRTVCRYTAGYKNTYAGRSNRRFEEANQETGITAERWEAAKVEATTRGYLNKAGAITPAGRNAQ